MIFSSRTLGKRWYDIFLVLTSILLFSELGYGQSSPADSIQALLDQAQEEGERFELTLALGEAVYKAQPDTVVSLVNAILPEATTWATTTAQRHLVDDLTILLGRAYSRQRRFPEAIQQYRSVYERVIDSENAERVFEVALLVGKEHMQMRQFDSTEFYHAKALELEDRFDNPELSAQFLLDQGHLAGRRRQPTAAVGFYYQAKDIFLAMGNKPKAATAYFQIGATLYISGDLPQALEVLLEGYKIGRELDGQPIKRVMIDILIDVNYSIGDYETAAVYTKEKIAAWIVENGPKRDPILANLEGELKFVEGDYPAAIRLLRESLELSGKEYFDDYLGHYFLGLSYLKTDQLDTALQQLEIALDLSQNIVIAWSRARCLMAIGDVYQQKERPREAIPNYEEAYQLAVKNSLYELEMEASEKLYTLHKQQGNSPLALKYFERQTQIKDSLFDARVAADLARLTAEHEFDQEKQSLLFTQEQENFRQQGIRRTLWLVLAFLGLLLGVGTFYFRAQNRSNKQLQHLNQELVSQKNVIEQQKVRLEELDESKSRFFTNISHEFKTPLTIIKGMVEKVREKPEVHLEKGTSMIRRNTLNLLNLVTQILDLRKLESKALKLNPQQGDVVPYLKYLTESHSSYAEQEGLILQFDSEQPELTMDFDPEKLLRITSNLLSNAIKFTESGGHVYLRVKQSKLNGKEALQLEVEDTGIGIAQENQANIFTQFYQEDDSVTRSGEGTGIGLALTQELVHLMQGTITVNSVPKQGSTFTVLLPITRMATLATEWSAPQIAAPIAKEQGANSEFISQAATLEDITEKPRLLVVEDNRDLQQYLLTTLEPYYTVDLAENGAIGIEKAIETIPDLIISDVMMPEKDGFELTDTLKRDERTDHIPIILLTAKSDVESKISGLEKGADAYLAKPFEERELLVRIDKLLELRRKLQQRYANNNLDTIPQQKIEDPFLQKLQDYVVENINDASLNMDQISRAVGMSRTQVFRKLKALTGKSATLFIRSIRLRKGQELLRTTNLTISEIAYEVGFTSLSYFSTSFMEEFGIRPSTVRS